MKLLNIVLISEEGTSASDAPVFETPAIDISGQVNVLNQLAREVPGLAETDDFKALAELSDKVKAEVEGSTKKPAATQAGASAHESGEGSEGGEGGEGDGGEGDGSEGDGSEGDDSPLGELPFFGSKKTVAVKPEELKGLTVETLPDFAKKIGVDVSKDGWVGEAIAKLSTPQQSASDEFKQKYEALVESVNALPKELQTAVSLAIEEKDWRTAVDFASSIDLSKPFDKLSIDDKVKVHNYFFPEDKIDVANAEDKANQKAIKAAEAKYKAEQFVLEQTTEKRKKDASEKTNKFVQSADTSVATLKKEYPNFIESDIKAIEDIIKVKGIQSVFFDKNGNLLPDAAKKIAFALNGDRILQVAVSMSENKGKNKGKAAVLSTVEEPTKQQRNKGKTLTDEERGLEKLVKDSNVFNTLTY